MAQCPDELRLAAYHDGELSAADAVVVARHVVECEPCGDYLAGLRRVSAWMAGAAAGAAGLSPIGRARLHHQLASRHLRDTADAGLVRFGWRLSGAAAAVLVAGSAWLAWSGTNGGATATAAAGPVAVPPWVSARTLAAADPTASPALASAAATPAAAWYGVDLNDAGER